MHSYEELREAYPKFIYHGFTYDISEGLINILYDFEIEGLEEFHPSWKIPFSSLNNIQVMSDARLEKMIFSLGMAELVSYWKITCSPEVVIHAGSIDGKQAEWWKDLYFNGLGEFFYVNGIDASPADFMSIQSDGEFVNEPVNPLLEETFNAEFGIGEEISGVGRKTPADVKFNLPEMTGIGSQKTGGVLIPVGGGKDSVVSIELLKKSGLDTKCYIINPRGATINTVIAGGYSDEDVIVARRTLDKNMLRLNSEGFLNGHTPFSAIVAFSSVIAAYVNGLEYVALSNESSANESTVKGSTVNHQYSKSFKFEQDFNNYESEYIGCGVKYFSLLRPLSEYQIAKYFAKCTAYHKIFRSCNAGSRQDIWCGHCAKCLFVYLILSPFLSQEYLKEIFGADMLNDEDMVFIMNQLIGLEDEKPFECVGSRDEINFAICQTIDRLKNAGEKLPILFEKYIGEGFYERFGGEKDVFSSYYNSENLVPEKLLDIVINECIEK